MSTFLSLLLISGYFTLTSAWNYRDQHLWVQDFSTCNPLGARQSPLKLYTKASLLGSFFVREELYPSLKFGTGWLSNTFWVTDNNDRYIVWDRYEDKSVAASISGGPFGDAVYSIEDIEFHVGDNEDTGIKHRGSEHMIDSVRFQGELQIIFRNRAYATKEIAQAQPDGYAIISLLLKTVDKRDFQPIAGQRLDKSSHTTGFRKFIRAAKRYAKATLRENEPKFVKKGKRARRIKVDLKLGKFLSDKKDVRQYITYEGSFTSPTRECMPAVRWIVYPEPVEVLETFLTVMRSPTGNNGNLKNNWRKDVSSLTRFSYTQTQLAGYPQWQPPLGNRTGKVDRRQRVYRETLRAVAKKRGVNYKLLKGIRSKDYKMTDQIKLAEMNLALAIGTDFEETAQKAVDKLIEDRDKLRLAWGAGEAQKQDLEQEFYEQHDKIAELVRARHRLQ